MNTKEAVRRARSARRVRLTILLSVIVLLFMMLPTVVGSSSSPSEHNDTKQSPTLATDPAKDGGYVNLVHIVQVENQTEPTEQEETKPEAIVYYTEADAIALAKMAWGEALVTKSDTEMAATMWCVLNRYDSDDPYYKNCKTIEGVVKQSGAFHGYSAGNPLDEHLMWLACDVLERWNAEKNGETDVGRVLPNDFLFFHGDGKHNHFRRNYKHDGQYYDWSLETPYET